ncbi:MAG: hypothetical protein ACOY0T_19555 [Myxococcota bacterium]
MSEQTSTMRQVVDSLHSTRPEALLELEAFELALQEVWECLASLSRLTSDVAADAMLAAEDPLQSTAELRAISERMQRAANTSAQIASAFAALCRAIREWRITRPSEHDGSGPVIVTPVVPNSSSNGSR